MIWKVVFLALLTLSAVAVTVGIAALNIDIPNFFDAGVRKVAAPIQPMEPIDDESGPG